MNPIAKIIYNLITRVRNETSPIQLSGAFSLGMLTGLTPPMTLHWAFFLFVTLFIRVNLLVSYTSLLLFSFSSPFLDGITHRIGYYFLLEIPEVLPFWAWLYHTPFFPFTRFNNTVVFGSFVMATVLSVPTFLILAILIHKKRADWSRKYYRSELWARWCMTTIYRWYDRQTKMVR